MNIKQSKWPLLFIVLSLCLTSLPASGQSGQTQPRPLPPKAHHIRDKVDALKEGPALPDMPAYAGQSKFLRGVMQPANNGVTMYHVTYMIKDDPARVKQWYDNTLPSYKWQIISNNEYSLTAKHKDGHFCSIVFNDANASGYKTALVISYRQFVPQP